MFFFKKFSADFLEKIDQKWYFIYSYPKADRGVKSYRWNDADFDDARIKVSFANDFQARDGWDLATVSGSFVNAVFDIMIDATPIAYDLALNEQIADGDYRGWGFAFDDGVLKFKDLASA